MKFSISAFVLITGMLTGSSSFFSLDQKADNGFPMRPAKNGIYVVAHRGVHIGIPENSLEAYQKAIEIGCDFVEIDIRTTKDGRFVSIHNSTIDDHVSGVSRKVSELTLSEIRLLDIGSRVSPEYADTRVPTLEEILELCKGKIGIYLDLKDADVPRLVEIIKRYGMENDVLWYIPAFRFKVLKELINTCPACLPMPDPGPGNNINNVLSDVPAVMIATDMRYLNRHFVKTAHRNDAMITVDEKEGTETEWSAILDLNVDGIQTDDPERLILFLKSIK